MGGKGAEQGGGKPFTMTIGGQTYGGAGGPRPAQPGEGSKQPGKGYNPRTALGGRGSSNKGPTPEGSPPDYSQMRRGGIPNMRPSAAQGVGGTLGTLLGGFMLGGPGAMYGGYKGYQSGKDGWIGDAMNARSGERYRDYLEQQGVSRKDTALAAKHGALSQGARDQGYRGSENVSLLDEGEDYDSITGEIF